MLMHATYVSESFVLFWRRVRMITVAKKTWSLSHLMRKDVTYLWRWRVCQGSGDSATMSFFSYPSFLSPGPWYPCQTFKNLVVSSILYLFWVWSLFFWFIFASISMLLEVYFFQFNPSPHLFLFLFFYPIWSSFFYPLHLFCFFNFFL